MVIADEKKEAARIKAAYYNSLPERKASKRRISIDKSKARKVITTSRRFQEHTMDELLSIGRQRCIDANINWVDYKEYMEMALLILHWSPNVLSGHAAHSISTQIPSSDQRDQPQSQDE